jgi:hypothetical protein
MSRAIALRDSQNATGSFTGGVDACASGACVGGGDRRNPTKPSAHVKYSRARRAAKYISASIISSLIGYMLATVIIFESPQTATAFLNIARMIIFHQSSRWPRRQQQHQHQQHQQPLKLRLLQSSARSWTNTCPAGLALRLAIATDIASSV